MSFHNTLIILPSIDIMIDLSIHAWKISTIIEGPATIIELTKTFTIMSWQLGLYYILTYHKWWVIKIWILSYFTRCETLEKCNALQEIMIFFYLKNWSKNTPLSSCPIWPKCHFGQVDFDIVTLTNVFLIVIFIIKCVKLSILGNLKKNYK
jgi:hypothetical protein